MNVYSWLQLFFLMALLAISTPLIAHFFGDGAKTNRVEQGICRLLGVDSSREQRWRTYALSVLAFSVVPVVVVYAFQRLQGHLPFNPDGQSSVDPLLAFNTAVSFVTNTNWQNYGGESTMSHLTQMAALATRLLSDNMVWEPRAERQAFVTINKEADRLEVMAALFDAVSGNAVRLRLHFADELPDLMVDPSLLQRVLVNVVENAFEYSGGDVRLSVASGASDIHFRIVDSGLGIPEAERDRVFRPFQRLGDVQMEDAPGGGTTIVVRVPIA